MTETELRIAAVLSGLIILAGLAIAGWAVRTNAQRSFLAQGMFFVMLGLAFLVMLVLPGGILRTSLAGAFLFGAMGWALAQFTFLRSERREREGGPLRASGE